MKTLALPLLAFFALAPVARAQTLQAKVTPKVIGTFAEAMSTSFQAAPWTDAAFTTHPEIPTQLDALNLHHIRVQVIDESIPETAPDQWDFTALDRQLQPILTAADHSPEIQLAEAPAFLYKSRTHFVTSAFIAGYAAYAAGMVRHYNQPGAKHPIRYWGILNEPNYFHISAAEYVALYNVAVPAMLAVDPTIKLVALELGGDEADELKYLPVFARHVSAQTDILGIHFYSTCDQRALDAAIFATIPSFVHQVRYLQRQLPNTPVWVLENNVNADFVDDHGNSTCNPAQKFVEDSRGSSPFFAAWRATEFAQFARAGVQALYHWHYTGGIQYAEFNTEDTPAHLQLSYWLDLWLGKLFPPETQAQILAISNPDPTNLELFAARQPSGQTTILFANHTVAHPTDDNGSGAPRTVLLDLSALSPLTSATLLTFNAKTSSLSGPVPQNVTPAAKIRLTLSGYGVTFLTLN
jgi:hypothetical protein